MARKGASPWFNLLYIAFAISVLLGVALSVNIETRPMPYVQGLYDTIDALPENSTILWPVTGWPYSFYTAKMSSAPVLQHLLSKGIRLITYGGQGALTNMHDKIMALGVGYDRIGDHPGYGTQIVDLGIIPGRGATFFTKQVEGWDTLTQLDMYGTPLSELPLTAEIPSAKECDMIFISGGYVGLWRGNVPDAKLGMVTSSSTGIVYSTNELYVTGLIDGFVAGIKQGGQYEQLAGTNVGAQSLLLAELVVGIFLVGGMIIANVLWFVQRGRGIEDDDVVTITGGRD